MRLPPLFDPKSIRFRLTTLFVLILGFTLVLFSAVLYDVFHNIQTREFDTALYNHAIDLAEGMHVNVFGELQIDTDILAKGEKAFPFSAGSAYVQVLNLEGQVMARSRSLGRRALPFRDEDRRVLLQHGYVLGFVGPTELPPARLERGRFRYIGYMVNRAGQAPYIIELAVPYGYVESQARGLILFFLVAIPLTMLIAAFGGFYVASRALRPVSEITQAANTISAMNLEARLPISPTQDEIQKLSLTLNQLLDRLHQSFESQERFVADASHQLKTPLAILRGEMDVFRGNERNAKETSEFIQSISQEIDHLSKIVEDLLLLARMDAGRGALALGPSPVRLDEIALEAVSRFKNVAAARSIRLKLTLDESGGTDFEGRGDGDLLRSMLQNLLDNAIKYSPDGKRVDVNLHASPEFLEISVADQGPGMSEENQRRVFERFYRAPNAEAPEIKIGGVGLGLSIARRIAELHGGTIEVSAILGEGTTFKVRIKRI